MHKLSEFRHRMCIYRSRQKTRAHEEAKCGYHRSKVTSSTPADSASKTWHSLPTQPGRRLDAIESLLHNFLASHPEHHSTRQYGSPQSDTPQPRPTPPFFPPSSPNSYAKAGHSPSSNHAGTHSSNVALDSEVKLKLAMKRPQPLLNQPEPQDSTKIIIGEHLFGPGLVCVTASRTETPFNPSPRPGCCR